MSLMELTCNMPFNLCFVSSKFCSEVSSLWFYFIRNVFNLVIQETNNFTKEDVEAYKYALSQSGCSGPINYYREALSSDLPRGHTRTKIKAPTLVVWVSKTSPQQVQRTGVLCLGPLTTSHPMHVYISLSISVCTQFTPEVNH